MATIKKTVDEVKEAPVVTGGEWDKMVTIFVPRATNGEANVIPVSVNGRGFKVQRGVNVEVPAPIAEVLQHSFEAQEEAIRYIEKGVEKSASK